MFKMKLPTIIIAVSVVIALGLIGYAFMHGGKAPLSTSVPVTRINLDEEVTVIGKVKASQEIAVSFDRGGRITSLAGDVGTPVKEGQLLATVNSEDLQAQLLQAQAALESQQIKMTKLTNGDTSSDASTNSSDVQTSITNNKTNVVDKITDAYTKLDSALGTYVDKFFSNARTYPVLGLTTVQGGTTYSLSASGESGVRINTERRAINDLLVQWNSRNLTLTNDSNIQATAQFAEDTLTQTQTFLANLASIVNASAPTDATGQALFAGYRSDINNARTQVDTALSNLRSAIQNYASAKSTVSPYELDLQRVAVENAQAQVDSVNAQINKGIIRAPISGIISEENVKVGEVASVGTPVMKIISNGNYQIETLVSEADIGKINVGTKALVVLDAYGPANPFTATVITIDPAVTTSNGVSGYKVTLQFDTISSQIKSGMTANVNFQTASKQNVLAVPSTAIIRRGNESFVMVDLSNSNSTYGTSTSESGMERQVETGIKSGNGYTEIISGLAEGEKVFTFGK